jgi:hypothetical protein
MLTLHRKLRLAAFAGLGMVIGAMFTTATFAATFTNPCGCMCQCTIAYGFSPFDDSSVDDGP